MSPPPSLGDFVPELVCLGVDAVVATILYSAYNVAANSISHIKGASSLELPDKEKGGESLSKLVRDHPNAIVNPDNPGEVSLAYAVVRGNVVPRDKSLPHQLSTQTSDIETQPRPEGVIRTHALIEHKKNHSRSGFWYDSERVIQTHSNQVPFCLIAPGLQQKSANDALWNAIGGRKVAKKLGVGVTDWSEATRMDMDVTKDIFEAAPSGLADHVWGWVEGEKQLGLQNKECMLLNGTTLTAIGEVIVTADNNVKIQPPTGGQHYYLVKDTVKELIRDLERGCRGLKITLALFGGVGAAILCYVGYKYYKRKMEHLAAHANQRLLDDIISGRTQRGTSSNGGDVVTGAATGSDLEAGAEGETAGVGGGASCVVCLGRQREVILFDCSHVCMCAECAREIMTRDQTCPVCRATIHRVAPAFIS